MVKAGFVGWGGHSYPQLAIGGCVGAKGTAKRRGKECRVSLKRFTPPARRRGVILNLRKGVAGEMPQQLASEVAGWNPGLILAR